MIGFHIVLPHMKELAGSFPNHAKFKLPCRTRPPPPPVAHPQDFVPPFSNFVPPFSKPMQSVHDRDGPITPALGLGMWMTSHRQCPRGGGACECPRGGVFFNFSEGGWRHADNVQGGGGAPGVPPIQVQTPPPTWLAGYGPGHVWACAANPVSSSTWKPGPGTLRVKPQGKQSWHMCPLSVPHVSTQ